MDSFKLEILIYLILIVLLAAYKRVLSGLDNAVFYAKGSPNPPSQLKKYINNYHYLETPSWYATFGVVFLAVFAVTRLLHPVLTFWPLATQILAAYLIAMGSSGIVSYWYQGYINLSAGKPFEDPNENPKSEFAFGPIRFWWFRPWGGKRRKYMIVVGALSIAIGLYLIMK